MSFSSDIKQELNKNSNLANKELVKYELIGYLITKNTNIIDKRHIKYATESDYNINRFSKLLSNLNINHNIEIVGKSFVITLKNKEINFEELEYKQNEKNGICIKENIINQDEINLKGIIRGTFLGSGSINNPEKEYHLEIDLSSEENLIMVKQILEKFNIKVKVMLNKEKNQYYLYIKDGEQISRLLALIGANKAVMKFEDIRIQKEMRGKINRLVNCKSAILNKTINASIEQIEAIEKLKRLRKFNRLNDNLKEIANLRIENPDISLSELGKLLKNPVGKSGVNYRLKKIIEIANELEKGE